jgi:hypothetical protein
MSYGEGRMEGSKLIIEGPYEKFLASDKEHFRSLDPPYVPEINDEELSEIIEYQHRRMKSKDAVENDKYILFAQSVAALSNTLPTNLISNDSRASNRGAPESLLSAVGLAPPRGAGNPYLSGLAQEATPPGQIGNIFNSSRKPPRVPLGTPGGRFPGTPSTVYRTPAQVSKGGREDKSNGGDGRLEEGGGEEEEGEERLDERDERVDQERQKGLEEAAFNNMRGGETRNPAAPANQRLQTIMDLLNNPATREMAEDYVQRSKVQHAVQRYDRVEITGQMRMTPMLRAHMDTGYQRLLEIHPQFRGAALDDFIQDDWMRTWYAQYVALLISETRIYNPTRSQLNATIKRIQAAQAGLLSNLRNYRWDQSKRAFLRTGGNSGWASPYVQLSRNGFQSGVMDRTLFGSRNM